MFHCGGGSHHLEHAAIREARRHGLRLIGYDRPAYDRPAYEGSTLRPGRVIADRQTDVAAILEDFQIDRIAVWGFSEGAGVRPGDGGPAAGSGRGRLRLCPPRPTARLASTSSREWTTPGARRSA
jgi:hypothetical protein